MASKEGIKMKIVPVPVLEDNYAYLIIDVNNKVCGAVDPANHQKVIAAAEKEGVKITSVLTTHHHGDHSGGNKDITKAIEGLTVYGGDDRIPCLTHKVGEGDKFKVGDLQVTSRFTPCHTSGHLLYFVEAGKDQPPALFSGDTLFIAGCGKFFEGTGAQMHHALIEVVAKLPHNTQVWCGHEYTVSNLKFALSVEPDNQHIKDKLAWAEQQRKSDTPTIPSTVAEELTFNPFMRVNNPSVKKAVGAETDSDVDTMTKLRAAKDKFRANV
jgi:hydroxyacylglutathione hydrolase